MAEGIRIGFCEVKGCDRGRQMLAEIRLRSGRVISLCKACLNEHAEKITKTEVLYKKH